MKSTKYARVNMQAALTTPSLGQRCLVRRSGYGTVIARDGGLVLIRFDDDEETTKWIDADIPTYDEQSLEPDEEARMEAMAQHWQERKAIESEYVERPW